MVGLVLVMVGVDDVVGVVLGVLCGVGVGVVGWVGCKVVFVVGVGGGVVCIFVVKVSIIEFV